MDTQTKISKIKRQLDTDTAELARREQYVKDQSERAKEGIKFNDHAIHLVEVGTLNRLTDLRNKSANRVEVLEWVLSLMTEEVTNG